ESLCILVDNDADNPPALARYGDDSDSGYGDDLHGKPHGELWKFSNAIIPAIRRRVKRVFSFRRADARRENEGERFHGRSLGRMLSSLNGHREQSNDATPISLASVPGSLPDGNGR